MEVKFGNYRIKTDKYNYMFQEFKGITLDDEGKERENWDTWGYWGSLHQVVRALPDRVIRRSNGNLSEAMAEVREVQTGLETALRNEGYEEAK